MKSIHGFLSRDGALSSYSHRSSSSVTCSETTMAPIEFPEDEPMMQTTDWSESGQEEGDDYNKSIAKGGVTTPFPWKLHDMLDDMASQGKHSVVTWQPHGKAFMVHKPKEFVQDIMPHYFNQTKVGVAKIYC